MVGNPNVKHFASEYRWLREMAPLNVGSQVRSVVIHEVLLPVASLVLNFFIGCGPIRRGSAFHEVCV